MFFRSRVRISRRRHLSSFDSGPSTSPRMWQRNSYKTSPRYGSKWCFIPSSSAFCIPFSFLMASWLKSSFFLFINLFIKYLFQNVLRLRMYEDNNGYHIGCSEGCTMCDHSNVLVSSRPTPRPNDSPCV